MENTAKRKRKKRALKRGILITAGVMAFLALCYLVWTGLGAIPLKGEAENTSSAAEPIIPDLTPEPAAAPTPDIAPAGRTDSLYARLSIHRHQGQAGRRAGAHRLREQAGGDGILP